MPGEPHSGTPRPTSRIPAAPLFPVPGGLAIPGSGPACDSGLPKLEQNGGSANSRHSCFTFLSRPHDPSHGRRHLLPSRFFLRKPLSSRRAQAVILELAISL